MVSLSSNNNNNLKEAVNAYASQDCNVKQAKSSYNERSIYNDLSKTGYQEEEAMYAPITRTSIQDGYIPASSTFMDNPLHL